MKKTLPLACICMLCGIVTPVSLRAMPPAVRGSGQAHHSSPGLQKPMTVDDVIALAGAGLPDDVIIAQLKQKNQTFNLSTDQLIRLKKANVSDAVIKVMLNPAAATPPVSPATPAPAQTMVPQPVIPGVAVPQASGATPAPGAATSGNPNDPMAPHDSGIYLYTKDHDGHPTMIPLERAAYQGAKSGGFLASSMTYGIVKAKTRAVIPGAKAGIRVEDPAAVFYFYFDTKDAGLGGASRFGVGNLSNPNQFALLKLEVHKSNRETIIGQYGSLGSSSGSDEKSMVAFKSERIRPGLYKVTVDDLKSGEYCFLASGAPIMAAGPYAAYAGGAGAAGAVDIFDFGVDTE